LRLSSCLPAVVLAAALGVAGCGDSGTEPAWPPPLSPSAVTDFGIVDVNDTSPRHDETVSPRDYRGVVSAWYFGHAT
jgi:hypothetical protein